MYLKIADLLRNYGEAFRIAAMSNEQMQEELNKLSDPDVAQGVVNYLQKKVKKGSEVEAGVGAKVVATIALILLNILGGSAFAKLPGVAESAGEQLVLQKKGAPLLKDVNQVAEKIKKVDPFVKALNDAIKSREGREQTVSGVVPVGKEKIPYSTQYEFEVLKAYAALVAAVNKNKHLMTSDGYNSAVQKIVERAQSKSRAPFGMC